MTTQKITLTTNLFFESIIVACIPFIALTVVIPLPFNFPLIITLVVIFVLCGLYSYTLLTPHKINFSDSIIYVYSRRDIKCIKPEQVTKIKMTMTCFNRKNIWTLYYNDNRKKEHAVSFVPKISLKELLQLQDLVKEKKADTNMTAADISQGANIKPAKVD